MLKIGKSYVAYRGKRARLCADITVEGRKMTLWFAVDRRRRDCLALGRADAFVMSLLNMAAERREDILCEDPMSERLHYQLGNYLTPLLSLKGVSIEAPLEAERFPNQGAVGTAFSGSIDSLYTIMCHGKESEYPLTHLLVLNAGALEGKGRGSFCGRLWRAKVLAKSLGMEAVGIDTNLQEALQESFYDVYPFREIACALALQGLCSVYLLSCGYDAAHFSLGNEGAACHNLLTVNCASTESLTFYPSGIEEERWQKRRELKGWRLTPWLLDLQDRDVPIPSDALTYEEQFGRKGWFRQKKRRECNGKWDAEAENR